MSLNLSRLSSSACVTSSCISKLCFSTLWVTGNIIAPRVEVFPIDVTLLQLCVGFTFTQHFKMKNCTPLRTKFSWGDLQNFANLAVAKLTAEYFLDKGEEITVEVKLNAMSSVSTI